MVSNGKQDSSCKKGCVSRNTFLSKDYSLRNTHLNGCVVRYCVKKEMADQIYEEQ